MAYQVGNYRVTWEHFEEILGKMNNKYLNTQIIIQ